MANVKTEGTFYMEGLLEGPLLSDDDEEIINSFVKQAEKYGLKFHAAINSGRFSLLADTEPVNTKSVGESADSIIIKCLGEFLKNYSPAECLQLMSTLRSVEYIPGHEVQTIYCVKPDCTVSAEQRIVKANTIAPEKPLELKQTIRFLIPYVIVLCVGIGISAFFVPYGKMAKRLISNLAPYDINDLKIDSNDFEQFFQVDSAEADESKGVIQVIFKISESYPDTEAKLNELWKSANESLSRKLALESLARNYVRCVYFDSEGNFMGQRTCYLQWIEEDKQFFGIVIPFDKDIKSIEITY